MASSLYPHIFNSYDDEYIALDTDKAPQSAWGQIRTLESSLRRVHAENLYYTEKDNLDITAFQPQWIWDNISAEGVGGNRELAEKARNWRTMLHDRVIKKLQPGDLIVFVGSAFGGTSTGLFWPIAEYVADEISKYIAAAPPSSKERTARGTVATIGFVLFPAAQTGDEYLIGQNISDFVRELQLTHWRRRLQQYMLKNDEEELAKPGRLMAPVYCLDDINGRFPLYSPREGRENQGVQNSFLPMTTLYCLPTPKVGSGNDEGHDMARSLLAEALFAVCYIGVHRPLLSDAVDRHSPVRETLTEEDPSFCGLNMVVFKSGRARSLRQWFRKKIVRACDVFLQKAPKPNITNNVVHCLNNFLQSFNNSNLGSENNRIELDNALSAALAGGKLAQFADELSDKRLKPLLDSVDGLPIANKWSFDNFMKYLISDDDNKEWLEEVNQKVLLDAYEIFSIEHGKKANSKERTMKGLHTLTEKARKLLAHRLNSPQVRWLGNEDKVAQEVKEVFRECFTKDVDELVVQEQARKTPVADDKQFRDDLNNFVSRVEDLRKKQAVKVVNTGAFPYVVDGIEKDIDIDQVKPDWPGMTFYQIMLNLSLIRNSTQRDNQAEMDFQSTVDTYNMFFQTKEWYVDPSKTAGLDIKVSDGHSLVSTFAKAFKVDNMNNKFVANFIMAPSETSIPDDCSLTFEQVRDIFELDGYNPAGLPVGAPFFDKRSFDHRLPNKESKDWLLINQGLTIGVNTPDLQGLWMGTSCTNFSLRDILSRIYSNNTQLMRAWMEKSHRMTRNTTRRLTTLLEMVWTAALLGAIEAKAAEVWSKEYSDETVAGHSIKLSFKKGDCEQFFGPWDMMSTGFIAAKPPQLQLESISHLALSALLGWLRTGIQRDNSFRAFYPVATGKLRQLETIETDILTQARLRIEREEFLAIKSLQQEIYDSLTVTISKG